MGRYRLNIIYEMMIPKIFGRIKPITSYPNFEYETKKDLLNKLQKSRIKFNEDNVILYYEYLKKDMHTLNSIFNERTNTNIYLNNYSKINDILFNELEYPTIHINNEGIIKKNSIAYATLEKLCSYKQTESNYFLIKSIDSRILGVLLDKEYINHLKYPLAYVVLKYKVLVKIERVFFMPLVEFIHLDNHEKISNKTKNIFDYIFVRTFESILTIKNSLSEKQLLTEIV